MAGNADRVLHYLQAIAPRGAGNAEIVHETGIEPHQQVFQLTQRLMVMGKIRGVQGLHRNREWTFYAVELPSKIVQPPAPRPPEKAPVPNQGPLTPHQFQILAARVLGQYYGTPLDVDRVAGVPKFFDLVSTDCSVVGDAKYFTMVRGERVPPAKFSVIAEYVWLLEKTSATHKFLVFGNDRRVPLCWLERYGHLVKNVKFFFLSDSGNLEGLH